MEEIKANVKTFSQTDWLIVIACALAFWMALDTLAGALIGAPVGYLIVIAFRKDADKKRSQAERRDDLPPPPA